MIKGRLRGPYHWHPLSDYYGRPSKVIKSANKAPVFETLGCKPNQPLENLRAH